VVVFAIRGLIRGSVRQVFGLLGFVGGLWLAVVAYRWVGAQWLGARPAVVYWVLRWLVVAFAALAIASLFRWWGSLLGKAVQTGPAGWLDRVLGVPLAPGSLRVGAAVTQARTAHALVSTGARACDAVEPRVTVLHGLGRLLHEAERRARAHSRGS
jgi:hypothetical protein